MIRRFESSTQWIELAKERYSPTGYVERNGDNTNWVIGGCSNMEAHIDILSLMRWNEVKAGYDPNDLQAQDITLWGGKPCCGGAIQNGGTYSNGRWHDSDCDSLKAPKQTQAYLPGYTAPAIPQPTNLGRCTCGSTSVGSDKHSYYCDLYRK